MKEFNLNPHQTLTLPLIVTFLEFAKLLKQSQEEMNTCKEVKIMMNLKTTQFKGEIKTILIQAHFQILKILMRVVLQDKTFKEIKSMEMPEIWERSHLIKGHK